MGDPNWLLSALAQSSAAIIAIIGGFILTRVIGLFSEKRLLRSEISSLQSEIIHFSRVERRRHSYRPRVDVIPSPFSRSLNPGGRTRFPASAHRTRRALLTHRAPTSGL